MILTRRDFGKLAVASLPRAALPVERLFAAAKPNSMFGGVQIGVITEIKKCVQYCREALA